MFFLVETQHKPPKPQGIIFLPGLTLKTPQIPYALSVGLRASFFTQNQLLLKVKVKRSRYRPGVAQRVGRGIALLFHYRGTRRGWVVSSTPRPHFTPGKDTVPIVQEAGWAPGPVWTVGRSRPHRDSIPNRPARSQSLYRLSYPARNQLFLVPYKTLITGPWDESKLFSLSGTNWAYMYNTSFKELDWRLPDAPLLPFFWLVSISHSTICRYLQGTSRISGL